MEWRRFVTYLSNDPRISLDIAPLTILVSGALQPWKWQLTVVPRRRQWQPRARANGLLGSVCSCGAKGSDTPVQRWRVLISLTKAVSPYY